MAANSSFFRSIGAAALVPSVSSSDHRAAPTVSGRGVCTHQSSLACQRAEAEWAEAIARTKQREVSVRAKKELAMLEARQQAQVAEAARQQDEEERRKQAEARQKRIEVLVAAKEASRLAEAEAAKQSEAAEIAAFTAAVARRKWQERELRAMAAEEQIVHDEIARRDACAKELETSWRKKVNAEITTEKAEANERQRMACEDALGKHMRAAAREADERDLMAAADSASRAAAEASAAVAWAERVEKSKVALREERQRSSKETSAMEVEDALSLQAREVEREQRKVEAAAIALAKEEADRFRAIAEEEERKQRTKEIQEMLYNCDRMAAEDRRSRIHEEVDAKELAERTWKQIIACRKEAEQSLRKAEAEESARMRNEDVLAHAMRQEARSLELKRREAQRLLREEAIAAAAAERAAELQKEERLAQAMNAKMLLIQEETARQEAASREAMSVEDVRSRVWQAHLLEQESCCREQRAMGQEDMLAHGVRRDARARQLLMRDFDREFRQQKAQHRRRAQEDQLQHQLALVQAGDSCLAADPQPQNARSQPASADTNLHAQKISAEADRSRLRAEQAAADARRVATEEHHRNELLADEARRFEELYRQNRNILTAHRSKERSLHLNSEGSRSPAQTSCPAQPMSSSSEAKGSTEKLSRDDAKGARRIDLASLSLESGCNAAEIVAFAQKLSALSPAQRGGFLELDEMATFFTES